MNSHFFLPAQAGISEASDQQLVEGLLPVLLCAASLSQPVRPTRVTHPLPSLERQYRKETERSRITLLRTRGGNVGVLECA